MPGRAMAGSAYSIRRILPRGFFMMEINTTLVSHNNLNNENPIEKWYGMHLEGLARLAVRDTIFFIAFSAQVCSVESARGHMKNCCGSLFFRSLFAIVLHRNDYDFRPSYSIKYGSEFVENRPPELRKFLRFRI